MLIALKIHAGRLTDFRDIIALCKDIDVNTVKMLVNRGDLIVVQAHVKLLLELMEKREFIDSFKGIFAEKKYDVDWKSVRLLLAAVMRILNNYQNNVKILKENFSLVELNPHRFAISSKNRLIQSSLMKE